jgi:stress response protein YsnF
LILRETIIPRIEERLEVDKQTVIDVSVSVSTHSEITEQNAEARLEQHQVDVKRVPSDAEFGEAPEMRTEGDTTIIPVIEERLVKRLFLVEEVHIRRHTTTEPIRVPVVLCKQTVSIERHQENKEN